MIPFLKSVAIEVTARWAQALGNFLVVVPHKRGVTYLSKYFEEVLSDRLHRLPVAGEMPRIITIAQFVEQLSGLKKASRLQLLFTLFDAYRNLRSDGDADFEKFRRWGETVVSDFNDVDMYDVDPDALFRNLADYNDIQTDYLTDKQRSVIEKYFGISNPGEHVEGFWKNFNKGGEVGKRFLSLWTLLAPLYKVYVRMLLSKGLAYPGLAFGQACRNIEKDESALRGYARILFVGFNALSTIERRLFNAVRSVSAPGPDHASLADFFWDAPGPALAKDSPVDAGRFLRRNAADFSCSVPGMDKYGEISGFPTVMKEIACPGNTAQAKVITTILEGIIKGHGEPYIEPARVAVVLPDEGLLFPVFHSIPADLAASVNLTMGYPLRLTAVAAFVSMLHQLHVRARVTDGNYKFFSKDVMTLLSHPLMRSMTGHEEANRLQGFMLDRHLYFVSPAELLTPLKDGDDDRAIEAVRAVFSPIDPGCGPAEVCRVMREILERARTSVEAARAETSEEETPAQADMPALIETAHIDRYLDAFKEFSDLCEDYRLQMSARTALSLAVKLISGDTVTMQGKPLTGLQVMGMLETRALDFDYLIIPSMNERVFPRKLRPRTFIPDTLRIGYGIATTRFQEEIFSYHFYRLIARAKEVYMLYDASQGGLRSGDPSRYLLQLRHLFGDAAGLQKVSARFSVATPVSSLLKVPKAGNVRLALSPYLTPDSDKRLSASSLKDYMSCPVKFCLSHLLGKKADNAPSEFMDASVIGSVLHETMQYIYDTLSPSLERPALVTRSMIEDWLSGRVPVGEFESIEAVSASMIRKLYARGADAASPLPGDAALTLQLLVKQVEWCLQADMHIAPFEYLASELRLPAVHVMEDGRRVNMTMIIDRLDRITLADGTRRLRIVDYKTGRDETSFKSVDELFSIRSNRLAIFQLMLYAHLYAGCFPESEGEPIALSIYKTRALHVAGFDTAVTLGKKPVYSHLSLLPQFRKGLDTLLSELFDTDIDFVPPEGAPSLDNFGVSPCNYCNYKGLCLS